MNDYKELCEHPQAGWGYVDELRDAIKQLVKERDAAVADMEAIANNMFLGCQYCKTKCTEEKNCLTGDACFEWRGKEHECN